jgi:hypothetical protein
MMADNSPKTAIASHKYHEKLICIRSLYGKQDTWLKCMKHGHNRLLHERKKVAYFRKASEREITQKNRAVWLVKDASKINEESDTESDEDSESEKKSDKDSEESGMESDRSSNKTLNISDTVLLKNAAYENYYLTFNPSNPCEVKQVLRPNNDAKNIRWIIEEEVDSDHSAVYIRPYRDFGGRIFYLMLSETSILQAGLQAVTVERRDNIGRMKMEIIPLEATETQCLLFTVCNNSDEKITVKYGRKIGISQISGESVTTVMTGHLETTLKHCLSWLKIQIEGSIEQTYTSQTEVTDCEANKTTYYVYPRQKMRVYQVCCVCGPYRLRTNDISSPEYTMID